MDDLHRSGTGDSLVIRLHAAAAHELGLPRLVAVPAGGDPARGAGDSAARHSRLSSGVATLAHSAGKTPSLFIFCNGLQGRTEEAAAILAKAAAMNRKEEVKEPIETMAVVGEGAETASLLDLFRTPALRRKVIVKNGGKRILLELTTGLR